MAEKWELKSLERRIVSLEEGLERDRRRAQEEKDKAREEKEKAQAEKRRRSERRTDMTTATFMTLYVAVITAYLVLCATGTLYHH